MNLKKGILLLIISILTIVAPVRSQTSDPVNSAVPVEYDPIVAMLDSLVSLHHVLRFNNSDANCRENEKAVNCGTGPVFSHETYSQRISTISSPIPLSYNAHVRSFIDLYANKKRGLTQRAMGLSTLYFPMFEEVLDREKLPLEFKYLAVVESALNPVAVSRVGATGIWQFMYQTGLMYDLKVNSYMDDRRDPYKATMAACQYFKDMYAIYNDWLLVIAAYNCGAGNVNKAIRRSGGKKSFWEIMPYLPQETRNYVPAFIAVAYVMNFPKEHELSPVYPEYNYFEVDTVLVDGAINMNLLSQKIDLPVDVITYLNPVYKRGQIPDVSEKLVLRLPVTKVAAFLQNQNDLMTATVPVSYAEPVAEASTAGDAVLRYETVTKKVKKTHTVRRGETLSGIADKYNMSLSEVKKVNHLRTTSLRAGQRLSVYSYVKTKVPVMAPVALPKEAVAVKPNADSSVAKEAQQTAATTTKDTQSVGNVESQRPNVVYHLVQPGDTLWNIAQRYEGVTVEGIKKTNNLRNSTLRPGTKLKVVVTG